MACSAGTKKGGCGCASCAGTGGQPPVAGLPSRQQAAKIPPFGTQLSREWTGGAVTAKGTTAPPIGVRPSAPEPSAFLLPFNAEREPIPLGVLLDELFPDASLPIEESLERFLRMIPPSRWPDIRTYLLTIPAGAPRITMLSKIAFAGGEIPDPESLDPDTQVLIGYIPLKYRRNQASSSTQAPYAMPGGSLPARQVTCIVNGFDPRWGTPPSTYLGMAIQFDANLGVYKWDPLYASRHSAGPGSFLVTDYNNLTNTYKTGWALQPYRYGIASPWQFRWILPKNPPAKTCS